MPEPKQKKIKMKEVTRITTVRDKHGNTKTRVVEKVLELPQSSIRAKKLKMIGTITQLVQEYKISPTFGNWAARMIKNPKINPRWKHFKPKQYIDYGDAEWKFKDTARTALNELVIMQKFLTKSAELGLDEERKPDVEERFKQKRWMFCYKYPEQAVKYDSFIKRIKSCDANLAKWYMEVAHDKIEHQYKDGKIIYDQTGIEKAKQYLDNLIEKVKVEQSNPFK